MSLPRGDRRANPSTKTKKHLNFVAYDANSKMPKGYERDISDDEYRKWLDQAPVVWDHLDGKVGDWIPTCGTTTELRDIIKTGKHHIGKVVQPFYANGKLCASIEQDESVDIPQAMLDWMQTLEISISDICWPKKEGGYKKPEIVEVSQTLRGARSNCKIVGQNDPATFRRDVIMENFTPAQLASLKALTERLKTLQEAEELAKQFPTPEDAKKLEAAAAETIDKVGAAWLRASQIESAAKAMLDEQSAATASAPVPTPVVTSASASNDTQKEQKHEFWANKLAADKFKTDFGIPEATTYSFIKQNGINAMETVLPLLTQASVTASQRKRPAEPGDEPARQRPRTVDPPTSAPSIPQSLQERTQMFRDLAKNLSPFTGSMM